MERADVRWVGARRKKSTQVFELILLFTSVDGLFCLGTRETITTSTVETLYNYPKKITTSRVETLYRFWLLLGH